MNSTANREIIKNTCFYFDNPDIPDYGTRTPVQHGDEFFKDDLICSCNNPDLSVAEVHHLACDAQAGSKSPDAGPKSDILDAP